MQTCKLLSTLGACALITAGASAAVITPISGIADSAFNGGVNGTQTVNNSGLSALDDLSATHTENGDGNGQWITAVGITGNTNITFDLGGTYDLTNAHIWQHNQPTLLTRGVNQFDILVSTNGGGTYTEVVTDATLAISPGGNAISAQIVGLSASNVTHVRFHIDSNHGNGDVVGLAEVKFEDVPEPGSLALLGLGGLLIARRRRA